MSVPSTYIRPSLNRIAVPIVGEFLLGISVAMAVCSWRRTRPMQPLVLLA